MSRRRCKIGKQNRTYYNYYITKFSKEDSAQHPAGPSHRKKPLLIQIGWKKRHQINPQTEVHTLAKKEPSSAGDDSNQTVAAATATCIVLKKGNDIKSSISRFNHG
jgi:hypothetical protein